MRETGRPVVVTIIPRPSRRRGKPARLPLWALLAVLSVFIGAFAVAASGGFLPRFSEPIAERAETAAAPVAQPRGQAVLLPVAPTALPASEKQSETKADATELSSPRAEAIASDASQFLPQFTRLQGLRHEYQGWNNCAPSTVGMLLSYFGRTEAQAEIAPYLKPDPNDKNVSPPEIAAYIAEIGFRAHVGVGGDLSLLKQLLAAGFPVIVEFWMEPEPDDGFGHYRLLFGYDDRTETFNAHDSYVGPDITTTYAELDSAWQVFNRTYVVIYPDENQAAVDAILTDNNKGRAMWEQALRAAQDELALDRNDVFAWFNVGTSALQLGDTRQAAQAFDWAQQLGLPARMLWYQFGPFEAFLAQGRYQDVIALAEANLQDASIEEWHYWRGRAREMTGDLAGARSDFITALELNANFIAARAALEQSDAA